MKFKERDAADRQLDEYLERALARMSRQTALLLKGSSLCGAESPTRNEHRISPPPVSLAVSPMTHGVGAIIPPSEDTAGSSPDVLGPPLEEFFTPRVTRLLYDPTACCPLGHTAVRPYAPYKTECGTVRRFYCFICEKTYSELIKPKQEFELAFLVGHYFAKVSLRRFPVLLQFIGRAFQVSQTGHGFPRRLELPGLSESTEKRIVRKYAMKAADLTADNVTTLLRPHSYGFYGLDALNVPVLGEDRTCFLAENLVTSDIHCSFLTSPEEPTETVENWRRFLRGFARTVKYTRGGLKQSVMDDRKEAWEASRLELPLHVRTLDSQHVIADIEEEYLPKTFRSPKLEAMISEIKYALRYSESKEQANQIVAHVLSGRSHWLEGEKERAQRGVRETFSRLDQDTLRRLLSHWGLVRPGNALHFHTTNPTESTIGRLRETFDSLNCFQSDELVRGQVNLIILIARLTPNSRSGLSPLRRGGVKKALDDLLTLLNAFDAKSPVR